MNKKVKVKKKIKILIFRLLKLVKLSNGKTVKVAPLFYSGVFMLTIFAMALLLKMSKAELWGLFLSRICQLLVTFLKLFWETIIYQFALLYYQ
jgi:hypothetical protein